MSEEEKGMAGMANAGAADGKRAEGDEAGADEDEAEATRASEAEAETTRAAEVKATSPGWWARLQLNGKATGLLAAALLGLGGLGYYAGHTRLWLVNGLDGAVVVEIDGARHPVAAGATESAWTSTGVHRVRVLGGAGEVLDEDAVCLVASGSEALNVYNVLGAAPLYLETVEYRSKTASPRAALPEAAEMLGGKRFASRDEVAYLFEEPPASLTLDRASGSVQRRHAGVAPGGWRTTVSYLAENRSPEAAAALAREVSRAQPAEVIAMAAAAQLGESAGGIGAAVKLARAWRETQPGSDEGHRFYQSFQLRAVGERELGEEYRAWYAASEKTAAQAMLLARVLPPKEARAVVDEALGRHPEAAILLLRKGLIATLEGSYGEADGLFAKAEASPDYRYFAGEHARALVALGRADEAARRLAGVLEKENEATLALTFAQVARLPGVTPPVAAWTYIDRLAGKAGGSWLRAWARALLGDNSEASTPVAMKSDDVDLAQVHLRAGESAAQAWSACAKLSPVARGRIESTAAVLLGAELARAGDLDLAEKLLAPRRELLLPARMLIDYAVAGIEAPELARLLPDQRAALDFVRARVLQAAGEPAEGLLAAARRGDLLRGVVSRAMASWEKPKPAATGQPGTATKRK